MKSKIEKLLILNNGTYTITKKSLDEIGLTLTEAYNIYHDFTPCKNCEFISFSKGYKKCQCNYENEKDFYLDLRDKNGYIQGSIYKKYSLNKERVQRVLKDFPKCSICSDDALYTKTGFRPYCEKHKTEYKSIIQKNKNIEEKNIIKAKREKTCLSKFGSSSNLNSKGFSEKAKQTKLERYGDENYSNVEKAKKTKLDRYGDENYSNVEKAKKTKLVMSKERRKLYLKRLSKAKLKNVNSKRTNIKNINEIYFRENFIKDGFFLFEACQKHTLIPSGSLNQLKQRFNITEPNKLNTITIEEKINREFLNIFSIRNRTVIKPLELDLYSDKIKTAIEYHGLMWHSFGKSKYSMFDKQIEDGNKHLIKTELCEEKGIQLYQIFENEWLDKNKRDIWISMIGDKQGLNTKIGARKCTIKNVPTKEARDFINENHIQGYTNGKIKIGLYFEDELLSIMTFGLSRFSKKYEYELIRFCTKKGYSVQGGASRLLKAFEREYKPKSLISYANRRWSTGNLYGTIGFTFSHDTKPNYFYFKTGSMILESRNKFQKHKLKDLLEVYDEKKSGTKNMFDNGYRKIYDSGNKVYYKYYK